MSYRSRNGHAQRKQKNQSNESDGTVPENCSPTVEAFKSYQLELDTRYDKYERLVKKSRDITIESKRVIFLLHRIPSDGQTDEILLEAANRLNCLFKEILNNIVSELSKMEIYKFLRAFSPGLQEYVEAVTFYYYLKKGVVVDINTIHNPDFLQVPAEEEKEVPPSDPVSGPGFPDVLLPPDFVLGIADLTGELMRKCINSVAAGNIHEPFHLCQVLQGVHEAFLSNPGNHRELKRKMATLRASLQKVENACYAIRIRGSEIPQHMLADFFTAGDEDFGEEGGD